MQNASPRMTLSARGLKKSFSRGDERFEIIAPEIDLVAGEVTAIVGESGSGKSTLLDMLALISAPDAATSFEIALDDHPSADVLAAWRAGDEEELASLRRRVGLVLQDGGLLPFLDIKGNAVLARRLAGRRGGSQKIDSLAQELGVKDKLKVRPATLSGGERQRAAILRAMAHEPALLVADEPTAAVDGIRAEAIMKELAKQAAQQGAACVVVSHDMALVQKVAQRIYRIEVEKAAEGHFRATCSKAAGGASPNPALTAAAQRGGPQGKGGGGALTSGWLAAKDLLFDARFSLASIAAIAAVIAPLLLLLGLKQGVVEHQIERLVQDPRSRELTPLQAVQLEPAAIERWREKPEVSFVAPGIARGASGVVASVPIPPQVASRPQQRLMDLLATEVGDPLLLQNGSAIPAAGEVALSHTAAVSLSSGRDPASMVGAEIDLLISRRSDGRRQFQNARVKVVGVLDPRADPLERLYAPFGFVASVEAYRASRRDDLWDGSGEATVDPKQRFRGFRMYARSIDDVEPLYQALEAEGVKAAARLGPIRAVREIDSALTTLLALVAIIGVGAAFSAMAANLVSMVERKRGEIALLRMMGLRRGGAFALPVAASIIIAFAAALAACGVYAAASAPINLYLSEILPFGDRISRLSFGDMALATLSACLGAAICAVFAARRAARVEPATALRRE